MISRMRITRQSLAYRVCVKDVLHIDILISRRVDYSGRPRSRRWPVHLQESPATGFLRSRGPPLCDTTAVRAGMECFVGGRLKLRTIMLIIATCIKHYNIRLYFSVSSETDVRVVRRRIALQSSVYMYIDLQKDA